MTIIYLGNILEIMLNVVLYRCVACATGHL